MAAQAGQSSLLKLLLGAKADVHIAQTRGLPIWIAAKEQHADVVQLLKASNADVVEAGIVSLATPS